MLLIDREKTLVILDPSLKKGFTSIPNALLMARGLSLAAKAMYAILLSFAWQNEECFPGQDKLAEAAGCTDRTVRKYLDELREFGVISWVQRGLNQTNIYYLHDLQSVPALQPNSDADRNILSGQDRKILSDIRIHSINNVVVVPPTPHNNDQTVDTHPATWTPEEFQANVQRVAGADISLNFAREMTAKYSVDALARQVDELARQLAAGLIIKKGLGAWLRRALERGYEPDTRPPTGTSGKPNNRHQPTNPRDYLDPEQAAELEELRTINQKRSLEKELKQRKDAERRRKELLKLYAN